MTLFDEGQRTDDSRSPESEAVFTFLNRSPRPDVQRIRAELERWFDDYPSDHQHDLRQAFRSTLNTQFHAAFWELYLRRLLKLLGFELEVHPALDDAETRPDFRVQGPAGEFLLEAATTAAGIVEAGRDSTREGWIIDALNAVPHPTFFVSLRFLTVGQERPGNRQIAGPVTAWLNSLDPDVVIDDGSIPQQTFAFRDWRISLRAIPKSPESREVHADDPLIGVGPVTVGSVNDSDKMLGKLRDKSGKYGTPGLPIVIAVNLVSDFQDDQAAEKALFGSLSIRLPITGEATAETARERNGFWMRNGQPLGTRVSAVMAGMAITPWTIASRWPTLWHNPWTAHPLEIDLPLPLGVGDQNGRVHYVDSADSPAGLFGLPASWPMTGDA